jgi:hypothetical protein
MKNIKLVENAHLETGSMRLPTVDGKPSIYVLDGEWYTAEAKDEQGNKYCVYWEILPDSDGEDESNACDWDNPRAVIAYDGKDVTEQVKIAY